MDPEREALIGDVYEVLPKRDCGLCGYGTCRRFARAVVEHRAPLSGCRQDPLAAHRIADILGAGVSGGASHSRSGNDKSGADDGTLTPASVRQECRGLMEEVNEILARISTLERRLR